MQRSWMISENTQQGQILATARRTEGANIRVMGYSSWSMRFFPTFSIINLSASAGIQVCTKEAYALVTHLFGLQAVKHAYQVQEGRPIKGEFVVNHLIGGICASSLHVKY
jgi:hypothetical protein